MNNENPYSPPTAHLDERDEPPALDNTSPYSAASLFRLFFKPRHFFADLRYLYRKPELMLTLWIMGIVAGMSQIDKRLIRADLGKPAPGWETISPYFLDSWVGYWSIALALGVLYGAFHYWILGWWYKKRLHWSGDREATGPNARRVFSYQELVTAGPCLVIVVIQTLRYPNYLAVWQAEEWLSSVALIFLFWSIWTSYAAATTAFALRPWRARVWFIVLPTLYYVAILGVVGALYAFMSE